MTLDIQNIDALPFEDIIDGYFPLQESLRQMMVRKGFALASVTIFHAPIMNIPGLAPDAPVPLRLVHGTAGIADRLDMIIALDGRELRLVGYGKWRWHCDAAATENVLSPRTRLAEPAIVQGMGIACGNVSTGQFNWQDSDFLVHRKQ